MNENKLRRYKMNLDNRVWIPWDEYLALNIGDSVELPHYISYTDKVDGIDVYKIQTLYRSIIDGVEHGCVSANVEWRAANGKVQKTAVSGTLSVNMKLESDETERIKEKYEAEILRLKEAWEKEARVTHDDILNYNQGYHDAVDDVLAYLSAHVDPGSIADEWALFIDSVRSNVLERKFESDASYSAK